MKSFLKLAVVFTAASGMWACDSRPASETQYDEEPSVSIKDSSIRLPSSGDTVELTEDGLKWTAEASNVTTLAFSPDGSFIAVPNVKYEDAVINVHGGRVKRKVISRVALLDANSGTEIRSFNDRCYDMSFSPDGSLLALSANAVSLWNTKTGDLEGRLTGFPEGVVATQFLPDGETLVSLGYDRHLKFWNYETLFLKFTYTLPNIGAHLAVSPNGRWLAVTFEVPEGTVSSLKKKLRIVEVDSRNTIFEVDVNCSELSGSVEFFPDGKNLFVYDGDEHIVFYSLPDKREIRSLSLNSRDKNSVDVAKLSPNGRFLAYNRGRKLIIQDIDTREHLWTCLCHPARIWAIAIDRKCERIVTAGDDDVKMWGLNVPANPRPLMLNKQ